MRTDFGDAEPVNEREHGNQRFVGSLWGGLADDTYGQ